MRIIPFRKSAGAHAWKAVVRGYLSPLKRAPLLQKVHPQSDSSREYGTIANGIVGVLLPHLLDMGTDGTLAPRNPIQLLLKTIHTKNRHPN